MKLLARQNRNQQVVHGRMDLQEDVSTLNAFELYLSEVWPRTHAFLSFEIQKFPLPRFRHPSLLIFPRFFQAEQEFIPDDLDDSPNTLDLGFSQHCPVARTGA